MAWWTLTTTVLKSPTLRRGRGETERDPLLRLRQWSLERVTSRGPPVHRVLHEVRERVPYGRAGLEAIVLPSGDRLRRHPEELRQLGAREALPRADPAEELPAAHSHADQLGAGNPLRLLQAAGRRVGLAARATPDRRHVLNGHRGLRTA